MHKIFGHLGSNGMPSPTRDGPNRLRQTLAEITFNKLGHWQEFFVRNTED